MSEDKIVTIDGARTAVGSYAGALKSVPAHELGAIALKEALRRAGVNATEVDEVIIGQVGLDAYNARRVALAPGLPDTTPAYNVKRLAGRLGRRPATALGDPHSWSPAATSRCPVCHFWTSPPETTRDWATGS